MPLSGSVVVKAANSPEGLTWKSAVATGFGFAHRVGDSGIVRPRVGARFGGTELGEIGMCGVCRRRRPRRSRRRRRLSHCRTPAPIGTLTSSPEELNSRTSIALIDVDVVGGIDGDAGSVRESRGDHLGVDRFSGAVERVPFDRLSFVVDVEFAV